MKTLLICLSIFTLLGCSKPAQQQEEKPVDDPIETNIDDGSTPNETSEDSEKESVEQTDALEKEEAPEAEKTEKPEKKKDAPKTSKKSSKKKKEEAEIDLGFEGEYSENVAVSEGSEASAKDAGECREHSDCKSLSRKKKSLYGCIQGACVKVPQGKEGKACSDQIECWNKRTRMKCDEGVCVKVKLPKMSIPGITN